MNERRNVLTTALASVLVLAMRPMPAPIYMNIPSGEVFKTRFSLGQAALCDDGVRLEKGVYEVAMKSLGDGTVRATFTGNGKTGHAKGKVQGHEGVAAPGGLQPGVASSVQKVQPADPGAANATPIHWSTLGFTPQSRTFHQLQGNHLNVIVQGQGTNQILIGLLLPAVQKVREAAAQPH